MNTTNSEITKRIGVTETGDPANDPIRSLLDANIIITKNLTVDLKSLILDNADKCILHYTITGLGESVYEENVPHVSYSINRLFELWEDFPISQTVIRIDPIIPFLSESIRGVYNLLSEVSRRLSVNQFPRVRVSMIDMYPHTRRRLENLGLDIPYNTFHAPQEYFDKIEELLYQFSVDFRFESCAESKFSDKFIKKIGCVSEEDIRILGMDPNEFDLSRNGTRDGCLCIKKTQLLKVKPHRCSHKCAYCFWKD